MVDQFAQDLDIIGKYRVDDVRGEQIIKGTYKFVNDHLDGQKLFGAVLGSPYAHARILSIDTSKAEALEGVEAVITFEDNSTWSDEMLCWGQEYAAVAAVDEYTAERALTLIDVDWEELPFNTHPEDAMASGAPLTGTYDGTNIGPPNNNGWGDVEAGFAEADVVIEHTTGWSRPTTQNTIEREGAYCWWDGDDMYGFDRNQNPHSNNRGAAGALGINLNKCHVSVIGAGGGFGGGGQTREPVTAGLLARKAGKPVSVVRARRIQSPSRRNHYGPRLTMKIGCKNDGTLTAMETTWYAWGGRNGSRGNYWENQDSTFDTPNIKYTAYGVATNTGVSSGYRCLAHPETAIMQDMVLQKMADELGMSFLDFMRKIFTPNYHIQVSTERPMSSPTSLRDALETAVSESNYEQKLPNAGTTLPDGRLYGIGIHAHYDRHGMTSGGRGAIIHLRRDGTALVTLGSSDYQGGPHALGHMAAEALGMKRESVQIGMFGNPDVSLDGGSQAGSRATCSNGSALVIAAEDLKRQVFPVVAEELSGDVPGSVVADDLDAKDGMIFSTKDPTKSMSWDDAGGEAPRPILGWGQSWGENLMRPMSSPMGDFPIGTRSFHRQGCAGVCEVAIDQDTGDVEVLGYWNVVDAGRVIDRHSAEGQYKCGMWVGCGLKGLHWNIFHDDGTGILLSQTMLDDKMPTSMDLDETKNHPIMMESISYTGPFGAHGIGEPAASANAACYINAVGSALGVIIQERPITPPKILQILGKA
ncbi:xanthine dehydrogenase family protein molybdopterin-binding subunit [Chloroflexota bacterium]